MRVIKHIWKYLTDEDYRFEIFLKRQNKKKKDE